MTTATTMLRTALTSMAEGKDITREAGAGIWGNYVRAVCLSGGQPIMLNGNEFAVKHAAVMAELEEIKPLTKEEKNSIASAKCVIKKVCEAEKSLNVWQYDDKGQVVRDDFGYAQPVGKSELQDSKSDAQRMLASIAAMTKKLQSENVDMSGAEAAEVARALQTLTADVWQFGANMEGIDAGQFMIDNATGI